MKNSNSNKPILITSYVITFALIFSMLELHLVVPAFIGMLVYVLSIKLSLRFSKNIRDQGARLLAVGFIATFIISIFVVAGGWLSHYFDSVDSVLGLANRMAEVLTDIRSKLPVQVLAYLPENILELKDALAHALKLHAQAIETAGKESLHTFIHIIIAMVISGMLALKRFDINQSDKPLSHAIKERLGNLTLSFECVIFAQAKIAAFNTCLTAIYLLVILPLIGIHLPYTVTMIAITFITGLIPIVGNLFSNVLIVLVSLGISFKLALMSLGFLILIHKLEYFINAKIVGGRIHANAWEILLAMLIMETAFGLPGLIVAPTLYAYIKLELVRLNLV